MQPERLKSLVQTGNYRPKPALIAEAMLRRRGVRELLANEPSVGISSIGRTHQGRAHGHPAV